MKVEVRPVWLRFWKPKHRHDYGYQAKYAYQVRPSTPPPDR